MALVRQVIGHRLWVIGKSLEALKPFLAFLAFLAFIARSS
jgi:hypothetical protein